MSSTQSHLELLYEPDQNIFFVTDGFGNIGDLNVDMEKELEVCKTIISVVGTNQIFLQTYEKVPEIYNLLVEKAYEDTDEYHRLQRDTFNLNDKTKQYLLFAFNSFFAKKLNQKFGTNVKVDYF